MNDILNKVSQIFTAVWLRRWMALGIAAGVALVALVVITRLQDRYEAGAKVYVDTQTVLKPLMNGLAYQPDIEQQVTMLAKTLISRPNVEQLVDSPLIGIGPSKDRDREIERLMKEIKIAPSGNNLYALTYRDVKPQRAQRIVQSLVELFVDSGIGGKRRDSEDARRFIDEQIRTYEIKLSEAENRLKEFKLKNFGLVGAGQNDYFGRASALSDEIAKLRMDLSAAENSRDALKRELSNEDPQLPMDPAQTLPQNSETSARLDAQRRQLDELMRRFTDDHPDVIATQRAIAQLEKLRQVELQNSKTSAKGAATSPVYQKIRIALAEAEANVASLRTQVAIQQSRLDEIRGKAGKMPEVEAQLAQLNRDYDILRKNYDALVSRRESAFLGVKLDQAAQLAEFKMVEPTRVEPRPVMPGRQLLAMLSLPVSLLLGVAAVGGLSQLNPSMHVVKDLQTLTGRPVLGAVSMFVPAGARPARRKKLVVFALTLTGMIAVHLSWVVWIILQSGF
jgi:polysaccharide chain length determinant protein (PEP-CTERM system associated)